MWCRASTVSRMKRDLPTKLDLASKIYSVDSWFWIVSQTRLNGAPLKFYLSAGDWYSVWFYCLFVLNIIALLRIFNSVFCCSKKFMYTTQVNSLIARSILSVAFFKKCPHLGKLEASWIRCIYIEFCIVHDIALY